MKLITHALARLTLAVFAFVTGYSSVNAKIATDPKGVSCGYDLNLEVCIPNPYWCVDTPIKGTNLIEHYECVLDWNALDKNHPSPCLCVYKGLSKK